MVAKSQKFVFYQDPSQMEPLLPSEGQLGPLLERASDLQRAVPDLAAGGALPELRKLLQ